MSNKYKKKIGIIGGSKKIENKSLIKSIETLGKRIDIKNNEILYGGGNVGMMCIIPKEFNKRGGLVTGINWKTFKDLEGASENIIGKEIVYDEFRDRQHHLLDKSDLFMCLPGAVGTLSEVCDILIKNTGKFNDNPKKILIYNFNNFYQPLKELIETFKKHNLLHVPEKLQIYFINNIEEILEELNKN